MKRIFFLFCCLLSATCIHAYDRSWEGIHMLTAADAAARLADPPAEFANHVIWGLQGNITDAVIRHDLDSIRSKGFKAVILEPGYHMPHAYLSDGYFAMIRRIVREAKRRGLKVWIIDEGKYPSGFAGGKFSRERPDLRMQALVTCGEITVRAGEVMKDRAVGDSVLSAVAVSLSGRGNVVVPVTDHRISFRAGLDSWRIMLVRADFRTGQTRSVDSPTGAKDTRNAQMDYLNPEAVDQFISWTHEQYKRYIGTEFGRTVMGFRGDEPDYSHVPFTPSILKRFRELKGYDVTPWLATFFAPSMSDRERRVKADYWDVWSRLFADTFFRRQADWCQANGLAHITHLNNDHDMTLCTRSEGSLFRALSRVQVPGVDAIWNQIWPDTVNDYPKFASSVAHVYGRPRAFSESFAAYYNVPTMAEAKYVVDAQLARGINFFEFMFWSANSSRPTWMTADGMNGLNDYSNRMAWLLALGRPGARIAMYYPQQTLWLGSDMVAARVKKITHELLEHQRDFDYVDDDALAEALTVGPGWLANRSGQHYTALIIPSCDVISVRAWEIIRRFEARGGRVLFWGSRPYWLSGKTLTDLTPFPDVDTPHEPSDSWTPTVAGALPAEVTVSNLLPLEQRERQKAGERRPKPVDGTMDLRYQHRQLADADLYFIFNEGHRKQHFRFGVDRIGRAERWSAHDGSRQPVASQVADGRTWIELEMVPYESTVIVVKRQDKSYDITRYGAVGDGTTVCTAAIQHAIDEAHQQGGGTVVVPEGKYLTGALHVSSGVDLHLLRGARIIATVNEADYPVTPTRFEGIERMWKPALLNFTDCPGVRVWGEGEIDGQGVAWKAYTQGKDFMQTHGRPRLMCFTRCDGGSVRGIRLRDQASWGLHVLYTDSFEISGVDIRAEHSIPSSDGIDIDSSTRVGIRDCYIEDNDDCISIKSGKDEEGRRIGRPSEDIIVERCRFGYGHSGVDIGSEVSGSVRRVLVQDCVMERGNQGAVRMKSQPSRGGVIEDITFRRIRLEHSASFMDINMRWRMKGLIAPDAPQKTLLRGILIEDVTGTCDRMGVIVGLESDPITDITMRRIQVKAREPLRLQHARVKD